MQPSDYEYRGLMAASWDLLRGDTSQWADRFLYLEVIRESGQPVLDVGCGTGRLLLEYLAQGIDVEGVDNSPEMLALLKEKAAAAGLSPVVYRSSMEDLDLARRYRTILVPSSSFQLVTEQATARQVLQRFYAHLEPGGTLALPFFVIPREEGVERDMDTEDWRLMGEKVRPQDGLLLRWWGRSTYDYARQLESTESRYELLRDGAVIYQEEHSRSPADCWYTQEQVRDLLEGAGFVGLRTFHEFTRQPAHPEDTLFTVLAERPLERDTAYVSDIPAEAEACPVTGEACAGAGLVDYYLGDQLAGRRWFDEEGQPYFEVPYRSGLQHGRLYRWDIPGQLLSMEPYRDGRPHGVAYQWADDGHLLGAYAMENGTGWDLWYSECGGPPVLSEARHVVDGALDGYEWWPSSDGRRVWEERHWQAGELHGIERNWNGRGCLRRGYPRYWIRGERVDRQRYLRAAARDASLPRFLPEENRPERRFPPEISPLLKKG